MSKSKKTAPRKKLVCFREGSGKMKAFQAKYTRNTPACRKQPERFFTKKQARPRLVKSILERDIYRYVKSRRIPKVYEVNNDGTIVMQNVGTTLNQLQFPRNSGGLPAFIQRHKSTFIDDITTALSDLLKLGYLHKDLASRNITYHKNRFYVIDFDFMEPVTAYVNRHGVIPDPRIVATHLYEKLSTRRS